MQYCSKCFTRKNSSKLGFFAIFLYVYNYFSCNNTNTIKSYTYSVSEYIEKLVHKKNNSHAISKAEGHILCLQ